MNLGTRYGTLTETPTPAKRRPRAASSSHTGSPCSQRCSCPRRGLCAPAAANLGSGTTSAWPADTICAPHPANVPNAVNRSAKLRAGKGHLLACGGNKGRRTKRDASAVVHLEQAYREMACADCVSTPSGRSILARRGTKFFVKNFKTGLD